MNAKKVVLSIVAALVLVGSLFSVKPVESKPLATIIDPTQFRVPVVGLFKLTRQGGVDGCGIHIGSGNAGSKFMDLNAWGTSHDEDAGTPIYASGAGSITLVSYTADFGLRIEHQSNGVKFLYAHLSKSYVVVGQSVNKGQLIGLMGDSGMESYPLNERDAHLHWEAWPVNSSDTFDIFGITDVNEDNSPCSSDNNDGTVNGAAIPPATSSYNSCQDYANNNYPWPAFFDGVNCVGKLFNWAPPLTTKVSFADQNGWNDRIRSIYIPSGWAVKVGGNTNDYPLLTKCFTSTQTNLDNVGYDQGGVKIGYSSLRQNQWDMISYIVVGTSCSTMGSAIGGFLIGSLSEGGGTVNGYPSGGEEGFNTVAIFDNSNCTGTQYGWHDPTGGWFDLNSGNGPDYMNDIASCIRTDTGWSALVSSGFNGSGGQKCFTGPAVDLVHATYYNGSNMNNNISSIQVFNDSTCNGTSPEGVSSGDTVTIHVDSNYSSTQYGWHDPVTQDTLNYVTNNVTSLGVVPGWSIAVYENANQSGGMFCFSQSDPDLSGNLFNNDAYINDNIESIATFQDTTCGGLGAPPNVSLTYEVINPENRTISATFSWSNAAPKWHILDWGDETEYGVYGSSGSVTVEHQYDPGDYTIQFPVTGNDRQVYTVTEPLSLPAFGCGEDPVQQGVVVYEFGNCAFVNESQYAELTELGLHNLSDFGLDDEVTSIHFPQDGSMSARLYEGEDGTGQSMCVSWDMWYMSLDEWPNTDVLDDSISSIEVFDTVACTPLPVMDMEYSWIEPHGQIQLNVEWSGAATGSWQITDWGDGTDYGIQGGSGTGSPTHWYPGPGTYTITFEVTNAAPDWGLYTITDEVTVETWECGNAVTQSGVVFYNFSTCAYRDSDDYQEFTSSGNYNLTLNDQATSLHVPSGKSVKLYKDANQTGDSLCVNWDMWAMDLDTWPLGGSMNDSVSSITVFDNSTCTP